jgi:regulation of enolase protein 1 (concanavalin A-like superfamily)
MPEIADIKSLPSYRLTIMNKTMGSGDANSQSYLKYEWNKEKQAEHAWREEGGKATEVYIKIADKWWMWMPGMGWIEQQPQIGQNQMPSDLASQLKSAEKSRFEKKGSETVNGVKCAKYEYEYDMTISNPNPGGNSNITTKTHSTGNIWISDQSNLPVVVIKSKGTSNIESAGIKMVVESEQDLTEIGAAITINPPEGAIQKPSVLPTGVTATTPKTTTTTPKTSSATPYTTTTTTSTVTTTSKTSTSTTGTTTFNDDFSGKLNNGWNWTDPNEDATYSLTQRPGYLRLTVPDGNDLAGVANFDAPRLLIPQSGNFMLETSLEFDPQEMYQGAGLLVWQNEDTFLRLEFGYGGMGSEIKNIAFLMQEQGDLILVESVELADATKKVELRLQRLGKQFNAWYRLSGGIWQKAGSTELAISQTIEAGIIQVTQYTSTSISSDFDYFRITK